MKHLCFVLFSFSKFPANDNIWTYRLWCSCICSFKKGLDTILDTFLPLQNVSPLTELSFWIYLRGVTVFRFSKNWICCSTYFCCSFVADLSSTKKCFSFSLKDWRKVLRSTKPKQCKNVLREFSIVCKEKTTQFFFSCQKRWSFLLDNITFSQSLRPCSALDWFCIYEAIWAHERLSEAWWKRKKVSLSDMAWICSVSSYILWAINLL